MVTSSVYTIEGIMIHILRRVNTGKYEGYTLNDQGVDDYLLRSRSMKIATPTSSADRDRSTSGMRESSTDRYPLLPPSRNR